MRKEVMENRNSAGIQKVKKSYLFNLEFCITDKYSILDAVYIDKAQLVFNLAVGESHNEKFSGGVSIVFSGDPMQLPPVKATSLLPKVPRKTIREEAIRGIVLWQEGGNV